MTLLTLAFVQVKADLAPTVMLHHNGQTQFYMYDEVQKAVDDALDGDTIYLTEGTFQPFNVNKRIMVRGAGPTTMIDGNCEINISGEEKLHMPVLDAMSFNGDVIVQSAYKQFTLRKCKMVNLVWGNGNEFWDAKIDRCWFTKTLNLTNNVKEFNAFNSRIEVLYPHDYIQGYATFEHCGITEICDTIQGAVFNSSAINHCYKVSGAASKTNLIGCVLNSCAFTGWYTAPFTSMYTSGVSGDECTRYNCSSTDGSSWGTEFSYSNYLSALDGTRIGAYGGQNPFTQWPEVPGVTNYNLSVDASTKTMKVKLTVDKLVK